MELLFQQLGISVLLGLLVGLQREHAANGLAGMRTFPLVTVLGTVCSLLASHFGGWLLAAGLLAIAAIVLVGHLARLRRAHPGHDNVGTTTDVAMLLMFVVGAMLPLGSLDSIEVKAAIAIGGGVAVLLQFKPELHGFARRLGDEDLKAVMQFVLITFIVLPVLPNHPLRLLPQDGYGDLNILNPFEVWLMVVLIVGMSLGGYILYKFFGSDTGTLLSGVLGGAISSTATTVSYARQSRIDLAARRSAAIVIMIASTVSSLRVLVAAAVASQAVSSPKFIFSLIGPMLVLMTLTLVPSAVLWFRQRGRSEPMPEQKNPTQLGSALVFGLMYAAVLLAMAVAKRYAGGHGLYAVAALSGLTEMDAITLSTARMSLGDPTILAAGWRMIVVAVMANMVSKTALAGILGGWRLLVRIAVLFSLAWIGGIAALIWP